MVNQDDRSIPSSSRGRVSLDRSEVKPVDILYTACRDSTLFEPVNIGAKDNGSSRACKDDNSVRACTDGQNPNMRVLYFRWLLSKLDRSQVKKYSSLLMHLFKQTFMEHESVPMDVNRARDGVALRKYFINSDDRYDDNVLESIKYDDCSWLEMLIALAERIDDQIMFDMNVGNRTNYWFWLIIDQMRLSEYNENNYIYEKVREILRNLELRKYKNGGKDGIFRCKKDVRKVEIWYQMMEWFNENTPKIEF